MAFNLSFAAPKSKNANNNLDIFEDESELEALALKKAESEAYYEAQIENEKISYMYSHPYEFAELFVPSYNTADEAKFLLNQQIYNMKVKNIRRFIFMETLELL